MKIFWIKEPIFNMGVQFFWDCSVDEYFDYIQYEDAPISKETREDSANSLWLTSSRWGEIPSIWLKNINDEDVVLHEIVHATHTILKSRGLTLSDATEEVYAYYQEFLFHSYQEGVLGIPSKIGVSFMQDGTNYNIWFTRKVVSKWKKLIAQWQQKKKTKTKSNEKSSASK